MDLQSKLLLFFTLVSYAYQGLAEIEELKQWLSTLPDHQEEVPYDILEETESISPIIEVVSCDQKGSIWGYKYAGNKGKRKMFKGKGKITFVKTEIPPHGYDYGMKSGHCLIRNDPGIKSIETTFDEHGSFGGLSTIDYFDGRRVKGVIQKGVLHGLTRFYEDEIDEETNLAKPEKRLLRVQVVNNGIETGPNWKFKLDGIKIFQEDAPNSIIFVPSKNESYELYAGTLEDDDMLVKAQKAKLTGFHIENGIFIPKVDKHGDFLDYDMQIQAATDVVVAKMIRFFEIATNEQKYLSQHFKPLDDAINANESIEIFSKPKAFLEDYFEMNCPYDPRGKCLGKYDGSLAEEDGSFNSNSSLTMISNYTSRSILPESYLSNQTLLDAMNYTEEFLDQPLPLEQVANLMPAKTIQKISGNFVRGKLQGKVDIKFLDSTSLEAFAVDNVLHGIARILDAPRALKHRARYFPRTKLKVEGISYKSDPMIREVTNCGIYRNGFVQGPSWEFLHGGNFRFGLIDGQLKIKHLTNLTCDQGAYVNPDMKTGYASSFGEGKMLAGRAAEIRSLQLTNQVVVPTMSDPHGPVYKHCTFEDGDIINDPLTPDPLEEKYVFVNRSLSVPGEQGVFAKVDIAEDTIVSFFGGSVYTEKEWNQTTFFDPQYYAKVKDGKHTYFVHLPDELGEDLGKYRATLGHKINHSFFSGNCVFVISNHPRFGLIGAAITDTKVSAGEELLCHYNLKYHEALPWYQEQWKTEVEFDTPEGPFGHREPRRQTGQPIQPMLVDSAFYKDYLSHATQVLKLSPLT